MKPLPYPSSPTAAALRTSRLPAPKRRFFRPEKIGPAFWTITGLISLVANVVLIAVLISIGLQLFTLKKLVNEQLIDGLYHNFVLMDQARIQALIPVETQVPARFDLPLETDTVVTLTEETYIPGARVSLSTGGLSIYSAPTDIVLPAGTRLPVHLSLVVPVDQQIPVNLNVAVDIPLNETDLHRPFVGLQEVVKPYKLLLSAAPESWDEALCGVPGLACQISAPFR